MTTKTENRVVVIVGTLVEDRRTHVERLNYWDEFPNPAHIPGMGTGFMDAEQRGIGDDDNGR